MRVSNATPLVSVAMPVRNCQNTIAAAIRSILNQTYTHWELLILEDGSSDETLRIARGFGDPRIKIFSDGIPQGIVPRLNQAIDLAQGEYFARMDGDDVSYPDRLMKQVEFMGKHPEVDVVGGQMLIFKGSGEPIGRRHAPIQHQEICRMPTDQFQMAHPTFFGRWVFFKRHRYRPVARLCEDQDLLLRSYRDGCFANLPYLVYGYREERIDLRKIAIARRAYGKILFDAFSQQRRVDLALRGVTVQAAKMLLDWVAVTSGLNYRLLRHRALPLAASERDEWLRVWAGVSG
jgi:glycosyltransferase involved in cell wall biosynthesis